MTVLVLIEHADGEADELSLQTLTLARSLAGDEPLTALLVGQGGQEAGAALGARGVGAALVAEDERLTAYSPGGWARSVTDAIERTEASAVVAAGTNRALRCWPTWPLAATCPSRPTATDVPCRSRARGHPHPLGRQPAGGGDCALAAPPAVGGSGGELCRQMEACCRALEGSGVRLWVDDRADLAALFPVAGVHLGQTDLPPAAARRVVGEEMWIGLSTHDEEQLRAADADPEVDVVAVGPVFPTTGKERPGPGGGAGFRAPGAVPDGQAAGGDRRDRRRELGRGARGGGGYGGRGPGAVCRGDVRRSRRMLAVCWLRQDGSCAST